MFSYNAHMKQMALLVCCVVLGGVLAACVPPKTVTKTDWTVSYVADVAFAPQENRLDGEVTVQFTAPADLNEVALWTPACTVVRAELGGEELAIRQDAPYTMVQTSMRQGRAYTLRLQFGGAVEQQSKVWLARHYLPLVCDFDGDFVCPAPCDWAPYARLAVGECRLTLTTPKTMVAAHCGERQEQRFDDEQQVLRYCMRADTGVCAAFSPYFVRQTLQVGPTTVEYYATAVNDIAWQRVQNVVQDTAQTWGDCPHKSLIVVQGQQPARADGWACLATSDTVSVCRAVVPLWATAPTACDTAPWVTASMDEYAVWDCCTRQDATAGNALLQQANDAWRLYAVTHGATGEAQRLDKPLGEYDHDTYRVLLQQKGLLLWYNLQQLLGDELVRAMRHCRQGEARCDTKRVLAVFGQVGQADYAAAIAAWIEGNVMPL